MISQKNGVFKQSHKGLLKKALALLGNEGKPIFDSIGIVAFDLGDKILVAKPNPYGYIVSCNKGLLSLEKNILMYIGANKAFYLFDLAEIKADPQSFINRRGEIEMFNFHIRLGKRWPEVEAKKT
jgi:hypothetical protein